LLKDVLIWTVLALVLSILFNPLIDLLEKKKFPRPAAGFFVYFGSLLIIFALAYFLAPPIILEMQSFYSNFSSYLEGLPQALSSLGFEFKSNCFFCF